jgi:glycogen(starch) synthase
MRIALLPSAFAPQVGGVEVLTAQLAKSLVSAGHEVEVWAPASSPGERSSPDDVDGLRVRRFTFHAPRGSIPALLRWMWRAPQTVLALRNAARSFRPDVLHVQCFGPNGFYAVLLSVLTGIPLAVTLQGETFMDDHDIYARSLFLRTGLRLGLTRARAVTGCSQFTLDDSVARFHLDSAKARVIFNGVDLDTTDQGGYRPPFGRFVFGLGRVVHRKGFDLLIDAWSSIAAAHPDVGLVVGGAGPELATLESLVRARGLERNVALAGRMSRGDVGAAMRAAEVFVMPSRIEAFGIVVLEAWRAGTPAVASSNGGAGEFIEDDVTGLLVDPCDTASLARCIDRLLSDPPLRARLAAAGAERVAAFSWSEIRPQYDDVYAETVAAGRS